MKVECLTPCLYHQTVICLGGSLFTPCVLFLFNLFFIYFLFFCLETVYCCVSLLMYFVRERLNEGWLWK